MRNLLGSGTTTIKAASTKHEIRKMLVIKSIAFDNLLRIERCSHSNINKSTFLEGMLADKRQSAAYEPNENAYDVSNESQ